MLYVFLFYHFFVGPTGFRWRALYGDEVYPEGYEIHGIDISHYQGKIDWEQLNNETLPANRGNKQLFGDCCLHHGLTITSDTSATKKGSWFMSWEKKMDKELIATLETVLVHLHSIRNKLAAHPERYDYYMSQVQKYEKGSNRISASRLFNLSQVLGVPVSFASATIMSFTDS